ncbi:MAG TPA: GspE/PulE family protein [Candidatus Gracilibacteria bacterium]
MNSQQIIQTLKNAIIGGDIPAMIDNFMRLSLKERASDIHIEPRKNSTHLRIRIDGTLREIIEYPLNMHPGVVSKLKLMSNLRIDESRIPQDGRINTWVDEREIDLRVSTLPTPNGEKIVMRVLDKSKKIPDLTELGIVGTNLEKFMTSISQPNGVILTTGPTGSGKTTTMYSALSRLNKTDVNILTLEDPIENQMEGLNQSQTHNDIGYTFATGLRTALRQDPDIIMVGEIRDKETIDIAIEASLTGHLVLSTIHTNSAVDTIVRILNMKVPDFLLTASVNMIIAQRLVRKLCTNCREKQTMSAGAQTKIKEAFAVFKPYEGLDMNIFANPVIYGAKDGGCEACNNTGFNGRVGIFEIMIMTESIKNAILKGLPSYEIEKVAKQEGMITLEQDGLIKVLEGKTSLQEVYKIIKK